MCYVTIQDIPCHRVCVRLKLYEIISALRVLTTEPLAPLNKFLWCVG